MDVRLLAPRLHGHVRLVAGMVRANRPWRAVLGLSKALAAAVAVGAFALVNQDIWAISAALSDGRLAILAVGSIAAMVGWLIVDHELWERARDRPVRERGVLYNAATVLTVALGVLCNYGALFALNLVSALLVVPEGLFADVLEHPVDLGDHLRVAWFATSAATVGGALGSGLESDEAVREAAYGQRRRRRASPSGDGSG